MKVRFRNTWFGPSEAYTIGKQTFRGQRYRKGQIYVLPDDYPIPSKGVEILEGESTYERPEDPRIELERLRKEKEAIEAEVKALLVAKIKEAEEKKAEEVSNASVYRMKGDKEVEVKSRKVPDKVKE